MNSATQPTAAMCVCAVCGATEARELYTAADGLGNRAVEFQIVECDGCGVLRTLPEMSEAQLSEFYAPVYWGEADDPSPAWIRRSQSDKTRFLSKCGLGGGRILDVGCGAGFFLRALDAGRWDRYGVETGSAASRLAARALGADHVFNGALLNARFAESTYDVVAFWSALEHMNEPRANVMEARRILKSGGTLIVQVPNAASYQARFFGPDWFALDVPRHRYHFTRHALERLLSGCGFRVYRATSYSRVHNSHALKHSFKRWLYGSNPTAFNRTLFFLVEFLMRPVDLVMTAVDEGATLTVAARAI